MTAGWHCSKERLLCLIVLSDVVAAKLSEGIGAEAFYRGFIVQDRITGRVLMRDRFNYKDEEDYIWRTTHTKQNQEDSFSYLKKAMNKVMRLAALRMGVILGPDDLMFFEPPDDQGNPQATLDWLLERDLISITTMEVVN